MNGYKFQNGLRIQITSALVGAIATTQGESTRADPRRPG